MKRILSILLIVIVFILFITPLVQAASVTNCVTLTHDGSSIDYQYVDKALEAAQDGDTIKFLTKITDGNFESRDPNLKIILNNNLTVNLNDQTFSKSFIVGNGKTVTFVGGAKEDRNLGGTYPFFTVEDNANATVNGGTFDKSYAPAMFCVKSNAILKINNVTSSSGNVIELAGEKSTVEIVDSNLTGSTKGFKVKGKENKVNITGGTFEGSYGIFDFEKNATNNTFNLNRLESLGDDIKIDGENNSVIVKDTNHRAAASDYAVTVVGNNNTYNVSGNSIVEAGLGAIYANSDTASIIIDNAELRTYNEKTDRLTPVIFSRDAKEITINDGTITGQVGIVALGGNININGGTITATNTDPEKNIVQFARTATYEPGTYEDFGGNIDFYGAAVIANGDDTKVNITGGNFTAATDEAIVSATDTSANYAVSGGIYNKPFDTSFVVPGKLELSIGKTEDDKAWYVGEDAINAVEEAKKDSDNTIDVLTGDITINDAVVGLKVKNSGAGAVSVNEAVVESNQTITATKVPNKDLPTNPTNPSNPTNSPKPTSPSENTNTNEISENPETGDNIATYIILLIIGSIGLVGLTKKKLLLDITQK